MQTLLDNLGYVPTDIRRYIWQRDNRRVFLSIVDDFESFNDPYQQDFLGTLTENDFIITDNWFNRPVRATLLTLPISWFGIYSYVPSAIVDKPSKKFSLPINRIDYNRFRMFLEFARTECINDDGLINFNCAYHTDTDQTSDKQATVDAHWDFVDDRFKLIYKKVYNDFRDRMPFRNHELSIDQQTQEALINIVVETYVGSQSIAFSEKTFRALVTPRPWMLFGGTWSVAKLESLGFDCLRDIVGHDTDGLTIENRKLEKFVEASSNNWKKLEWENISIRCSKAAKHNQDLLKKMRKRWPADFANWLVDAVRELE